MKAAGLRADLAVNQGRTTRSSCALFEGDLCCRLTSGGTFDVEYRSPPDRRTCRRADEAELSAIPSFFEIKEAGGVYTLSEKNRIVGF